jgi:hypothetical protein
MDVTRHKRLLLESGRVQIVKPFGRREAGASDLGTIK